MQLRDEPQPPQREVCGTAVGEIERDLLDCDARVAQREGSPPAHSLDAGVDPDSRDVRAVGHGRPRADGLR